MPLLSANTRPAIGKECSKVPMFPGLGLQLGEMNTIGGLICVNRILNWPTQGPGKCSNESHWFLYGPTLLLLPLVSYLAERHCSCGSQIGWRVYRGNNTSQSAV